MATQEKTWNVANRLHSLKDSDNPEVNHIIAGADEIYDDAKELKQSEHNAQTDDRLSEVETDLNASGEGIKDRVHTLEEQVAFDGDFEVENTPQGIVSGSGKVTSANAVRGAIDVRTGYFECITASGTAKKEVSAPGFVLTRGGSIKIKMTNSNTVDNATLDINVTGEHALYYAGERASAANTWDAGETVEVYYDGTNFYANNVAGGSGSGDGAFDVSVKYPTSGVEGGNTYTLEGALAVLNANLSASKKKGGMSIKFIQSSDNRYVQYRFLLSGSFTAAQFTDVANWQSSETKKVVDSYGFADNNVGSISIAQRPSSIGNPFKNLGYYYATNGKKVTSENYACTDLLPIIDNIRIGVRSLSSIAAICFYNSDKTFHSYISYSTIGTVGEFHDYIPPIPSDAKYFAVNISKVAITEGYIVMGNVEQYLADKSEFPELMHTVYDTDLVREHKIYTDAGVGVKNNDIDAVKLNVSEGDVLRITCNVGSSANYHAVKFYTSDGGILIEAKLLDGDYVNCKLVVPTNATFAICQGRVANIGTNPNHIQLKVDLYAKYNYNKQDVENLIDSELRTLSELSFSVDGKYLSTSGSLVTNTNYHCTDYQSVNEDDVLNVTAYAGSSLLVVAGYDSTKNFVQSLLSSGTYNNYQITIPAGISYVVVCGKKLVEGNTVDAKATLLKENYVTTEQLNKLQSPIVYDALMLEPCQGYYNKGTSTPYLSCNTATLGYRVSVPIPVMVGDVVTAGTTISYPFDTTAHVLLDANKNIIGTFNMANGIGTITQAMWNNGARYVVITFKPTDNPSLTITRSANAEPFVLDKTLRMKISPYTNGFILWIPSKEIGGKYVGHYFIKYYKKWDSLDYTDGDGQTQTLTDVVNTDVWNCLNIYDENMNYIMQGNTNFIFSFDGQDHVGDGHGNEVALFNQFIIDGKVKEITSGGTFFGARRIFELDSFECIWKSEVYRHGGGISEVATAKPYIKTDGTLELNALHYLDAKFEYGNRIKINNSLEIKQDNVTFYGIYGAMLECYFGAFSYIQVNNDENSITQIADDGESSLVGGSTINLAPGQGGTGTIGVTVPANEVKMWGKNFAVSQRMESKYNQSLPNRNIYIHKYADRLKAYLQPVKARGASAGEKEVLNSGDVISVIDYREIEV